MLNPILQMLNGSKAQNQNSFIEKIGMAKSMLTGKDPEKVFQSLMKINPTFRKFVEDNENKSIEDIAMEYDINIDMLRKYI